MYYVLICCKQGHLEPCPILLYNVGTVGKVQAHAKEEQDRSAQENLLC